MNGMTRWGVVERAIRPGGSHYTRRTLLPNVLIALAVAVIAWFTMGDDRSAKIVSIGGMLLIVGAIVALVLVSHRRSGV